jgi:hypothetical protein
MWLELNEVKDNENGVISVFFGTGGVIKIKEFDDGTELYNIEGNMVALVKDTFKTINNKLAGR